MSAEYGVSTQQISARKRERITSFADNLETSEGQKRKSLKVARDKQLDKGLTNFNRYYTRVQVFEYIFFAIFFIWRLQKALRKQRDRFSRKSFH